MQSVDGWWQSVGQSMSVYHHFSNGTDYVYQQSFDDRSVFTFTDSQSYTVETFEAGSLSFTSDSGVAVHVANGGTYINESGNPSMLVCRNMDGSGYSGSGSLVRLETGEPPATLSELAAQVER